ncbi:unnamed protein product [Heligmosomoides polygyrus]|uniref:DUF2958 domain-containing protein n=1 Tax=Heligmosomoides polygyrus TaxID=6339 RepID=A0A183FX52_HELPZ|nr:unnamed protein product [Heligmosomoides polygyrus]
MRRIVLDSRLQLCLGRTFAVLPETRAAGARLSRLSGADFVCEQFVCMGAHAPSLLFDLAPTDRAGDSHRTGHPVSCGGAAADRARRDARRWRCVVPGRLHFSAWTFHAQLFDPIREIRRRPELGSVILANLW